MRIGLIEGLRRFKTEAEKKEHVLKLNMARRHMAPYEWGAAFDHILKLRGVKRGQGARNDKATSATIAEVAVSLGVASRTAEHRLKLADDFATLKPENQKAVRAGEKTVKGAWSYSHP